MRSLHDSGPNTTLHYSLRLQSLFASGWGFGASIRTVAPQGLGLVFLFFFLPSFPTGRASHHTFTFLSFLASGVLDLFFCFAHTHMGSFLYIWEYVWRFWDLWDLNSSTNTLVFDFSVYEISGATGFIGGEEVRKNTTLVWREAPCFHDLLFFLFLFSMFTQQTVDLARPRRFFFPLVFVVWTLPMLTCPSLSWLQSGLACGLAADATVGLPKEPSGVHLLGTLGCTDCRFASLFCFALFPSVCHEDYDTKYRRMEIHHTHTHDPNSTHPGKWLLT
ncbi:hypothetical protein MAPG_07536 [Magnaporthiopsis poae ATCC 64411]|uniref:Uncharacterized protein n=1 Tax=Magnaporthiopsis poae (strain ATCC 64411 / 73-15) TaxID=644358 RepID=A0A0C4E4Y0_MAGP6|nr:hypothetical protein MAPG_07536 [Magnaporthiopsis poae ATCC 64411]